MKFAKIFDHDKFGQILIRMSYKEGMFMYVTLAIGEDLAEVSMEFKDAEALEEAFNRTELDDLDEICQTIAQYADNGDIPEGEDIPISGVVGKTVH